MEAFDGSGGYGLYVGRCRWESQRLRCGYTKEDCGEKGGEVHLECSVLY